MAAIAPSADNSNPPISWLNQVTRGFESRGVYDVWLLGITTVFCGDYFGWNLGLSAGIYGMLMSTILVGSAYVCFCYCVSEVTGALPFAGGPYGLARCTLGFFPAFLIGCCETIGYIGSAATASIAVVGMVVQVVPTWESSEPIVMLILYASVLCVQLMGSNSFWMGSFVLGTISFGVWLMFFFTTMGHADFHANAMREGTEGYMGGASEFFRVFPFAAWFYIGIEVLNLASDDFVNPKYTIPRGQPSLAITFVLTATATVLITVSLPHPDQAIADLAMSPTPLNSGFNLGLGVSNTTATALSIPASYATVYGFVWSYTKLLYAMASSKLLPSILATKSARDGTPYMAMIAGTGLSYGVCLTVLYKPTWATYVLSVCLLFAFMSYTGQCIGYISLKFNYLNQHPSECKNPFGIAGACFAIIVWVLGFGCLVFCQGNGGIEIGMFTAIVVCLTIYYLVYSKNRQIFSDQESKVLLVAHVMRFNSRRIQPRGPTLSSPQLVGTSRSSKMHSSKIQSEKQMQCCIEQT